MAESRRSRGGCARPEWVCAVDDELEASHGRARHRRSRWRGHNCRRRGWELAGRGTRSTRTSHARTSGTCRAANRSRFAGDSVEASDPTPVEAPALSAATLADVFDRGPHPQLLVDDQRRVAAVNAVARRRFDLGSGRWRGAPLADVLPAAAGSPDPWRTLWSTVGEQSPREHDTRLAAGAFKATLVAGERGALHVVTVRDAEPAPDRRATTFQAVADSSHDALLSLDCDGLMTVISARASLVIGYSERALLGRPLSVVVLEQHRAATDALVRAALEGADVFQHDTEVRHRDGRVMDVVVNLAPLRGPDGDRIVGASAILQDITERKRLERELRHQSERDPLTGLYNRRHLEIELHRAARLAERHGHGGGVVMLDVDGFKRVNDTRGHPCGDQLLRDLAGALRRSLRDSDVAARLGGDEFAVLLPQTDRRGAGATADKVLAVTR